MSTTNLVKFTFEYYSENYATGTYTAERYLKDSDSIRQAAISVMREAVESGADVWTQDIDNDRSIALYLASKDISDTKTGYKYSGFGIGYDLDDSGGIIILDGYAPLRHDWTYLRIKELVELGYIKGNPARIVIGLPEGLGAGPQDIFDWLGFFADTLQVVGSTVLVKKYIIIP
ncbi:MAG TPA: hypothetical protein VD947_01905, partial [Patescibacteria group bacterium]|nr:hypothetical protein [Patescibacteria group bacterium]